MKYLYIILLSLFIVGCSTNAIEMVSEPTDQKNDLNDKDGDGVINARDDCLKSASKSQVDNIGCGSETVNKVRTELLVNFEIDSYVIAPRYFSAVEALAGFIKKYPDALAVIEGHTSIRGSKELNETLSIKRAEAIKDLLVKKYGINEDRVTAIGYGYSRLLLEGNDEYIHSRNRRIVVEISSEERITDLKWTIYSVDKELEE